jgi:hypothetical protein
VTLRVLKGGVSFSITGISSPMLLFAPQCSLLPASVRYRESLSIIKLVCHGEARAFERHHIGLGDRADSEGRPRRLGSVGQTELLGFAAHFIGVP